MPPHDRTASRWGSASKRQRDPTEVESQCLGQAEQLGSLLPTLRAISQPGDGVEAVEAAAQVLRLLVGDERPKQPVLGRLVAPADDARIGRHLGRVRL